jgi:chromosome segregation ATPase
MVQDLAAQQDMKRAHGDLLKRGPDGQEPSVDLQDRIGEEKAMRQIERDKERAKRQALKAAQKADAFQQTDNLLKSEDLKRDASQRHLEGLQKAKEALDRQKEQLERQREQLDRQIERIERDKERLEQDQETLERDRELLGELQAKPSTTEKPEPQPQPVPKRF